MAVILRAGLTYFAVIFVAAFAMGILRRVVIIPLTGPLIAVALEVPILLALAWLVAGRVLRHWPLDLPGRGAMGAVAFVFLMLAELALSSASGQTPGQFLATMATAPGALGLAGQVGFGVIPALSQTSG